MVKRLSPRGPLTLQEKALRAQILQVRLYPAEKAEFRTFCRASGTEMSDVVRGLVKTLITAVQGNKLFCVNGQLCKINLKMQDQIELGGGPDVHRREHGLEGKPG